MIELRAGALRCELVPERGGALAGLWWRDVPVLASTPGAQLGSARQAACHPLVPFSNRVGQAAVVWEGTLQPQVHHPGDAPAAIHGLGWQRPWEVLESDASSAMLAFEHRADASWPFAFDCSQTLRLAPDALEMTLAVTNQSGRPAPLGLGWRLLFDQRPGARLALRASGRWDMDADRLPARRTAVSGLQTAVATVDADRSFDGWEGGATVDDAVLRVHVSSGLTHLVVASEPQHLVLVPCSHVPNAVHQYAGGAPAQELGLALLQPGESLVAQVRIAPEAAT
jgi:aldose 1-epimerase